MFGKLFYHLGPLRDESIFYKIKDNKTRLDDSEFILCTGLIDDKINLGLDLDSSICRKFQKEIKDKRKMGHITTLYK